MTNADRALRTRTIAWSPDWKKYTFGRRIAEGGFGTVYELMREGGGSSAFVCKLIRNAGADANGEHMMFYNATKSDPSCIGWVTNTVAASLDDGTLHLVLSKMDTSLAEHQSQLLKKRKRAARFIPIPKVVQYSFDVAQGLTCLANSGFSHNDLKPDNILLDSSRSHALVADLGCMTSSGRDGTGKPCSTPGWRSPEVEKDRKYSPAADMYVYGMLVAWMCFGGSLDAEKVMPRDLLQAAKDDGMQNLFEPEQPGFIEAVFTSLHPDIDLETDRSVDALIDIIAGCTKKNPRMRMSAAQVVRALKRVM